MEVGEVEVLWQVALIENPFYKKEISKIQLDGKVQEELLIAELEKSKRCKVYKVGQTCTKVKSGDEVFVETTRLMNSPRVVLGDKDYFIVRETDIVFVYKSGGLDLV